MKNASRGIWAVLGLVVLLGIPFESRAAEVQKIAFVKGNKTVDLSDTLFPLRKADVLAPIVNYKRVGTSDIVLEISRGDINGLAWVFADNVGFYTQGGETPKNRDCPLLDLPKKHVTTEEIRKGYYVVTLHLNRKAADTILRHGCAITEKPDI